MTWAIPSLHAGILTRCTFFLYLATSLDTPQFLSVANTLLTPGNNPPPKKLDSAHPRLDMWTAQRFWDFSKTLRVRAWRACVAGKKGQFLYAQRVVDVRSIW